MNLYLTFISCYIIFIREKINKTNYGIISVHICIRVRTYTGYFGQAYFLILQNALVLTNSIHNSYITIINSNIFSFILGTE